MHEIAVVSVFILTESNAIPCRLFAVQSIYNIPAAPAKQLPLIFEQSCIFFHIECLCSRKRLDFQIDAHFQVVSTVEFLLYERGMLPFFFQAEIDISIQIRINAHFNRNADFSIFFKSCKGKGQLAFQTGFHTNSSAGIEIVGVTVCTTQFIFISLYFSAGNASHANLCGIQLGKVTGNASCQIQPQGIIQIQTNCENWNKRNDTEFSADNRFIADVNKSSVRIDDIAVSLEHFFWSHLTGDTFGNVQPFAALFSNGNIEIKCHLRIDICSIVKF